MKESLLKHSCGESLRSVAYRKLLHEDNNHNFQRLNGVFYCIKCEIFVEVKFNEVHRRK